MQRAFWQKGGSQCGFCTPGFIMTTVALLEKNPRPTDAEIRRAISGNMCRCTGYVKIIESVKTAAAEMAEPGDGDGRPRGSGRDPRSNGGTS